MFTPIIRIVLVIVCLVISVGFSLKEDFLNMSLILIASGLFVYGYFKYGSVYTAFQQMKKGNSKKAEELISKVKNPHRLSKRHKSYYHFIRGIIALEKQELEKSYSELTKSLNIGLRTENDKSIVLLNLANIELMRSNFKEANEFIEKVRELDLKPKIKFETNRIEKEIKLAQHQM